MQPIAPSATLLGALGDVAGVGFRYRETKELASRAGWTLTDDDLAIGYVSFDVLLAPGSEEVRRLFVKIPEESHPVFSMLTLFHFDENEGEGNRDDFDRAFGVLRDDLEHALGAASASGTYCYPHRQHWRYSYASWATANARFVLIQDEMDIQFGMDLTLWVLPGGTELRIPLSYLYEPNGGSS